MQATRREFLQSSLAGATLAATGLSLPRFLSRTALAASCRTGERVLVVVQLSGGNDGLNTVVPYRDDLYQKARPTLRIAAERALKLDDTLGLHPDLTGFKRLYDDGLLSVVTNVGYPNPDRSHFRSMDIWHTADTSPEARHDGWLGRVVDRCGCPELTNASSPNAQAASNVPFALHLDDDSLPLALKTQRLAVPSVRDVAAFRLDGDAAALKDALAAPRDAAAESDLLFVQRTAVAACANAERIRMVAEDRKAKSPYPSYGLATRLQQIAQLIGAEFGPRIYYTSLGGFDTHARQALAHGPLLRELADSVAAFYDDLKKRGLSERVLLLTYSEFGRRLAENGGQGTDHGAAAPVFVVGPACRAGIVGGPPNLKDLDEGDVRHAVDFRSVYSAILDRWLSVPSAAILGGNFAPLDVLAG
jgi:uncharacterized protein (DUF1501 family)